MEVLELLPLSNLISTAMKQVPMRLQFVRQWTLTISGMHLNMKRFLITGASMMGRRT
jgi:hypothetical protein